MKTLREALASMLSGIVLLATGPTLAAMPPYEPPFQESQQAPLSASDLDSIVSPIALYPDQLVAQILGAATYPDQVTAASNFINSTKLTGDALMQEVNKQPWDPSVMALTQFPSVLNQMAQNLSWTSALGDAAYNQQADVMAAIQRLRKQAKDAGNLQSTSQMTVTQQNPQTIVIQPANPQVVYVPQYNPAVVYGTPYQPPGYSAGAMVATGIISFGVGMAVGAAINNSCCGWGWGSGGWGCNWHGGNVVYRNNVYVSRSNTFYGNNRYANNPYYRNNARYNGGNNRYNGGNNRAAWNSGNRNSGNTVNRGGNTVNINGDVNVGNRGGNNVNANNRAGNNANFNRQNTANNVNRPGNQNAADRGFGQRPQANNTSALGGYKAGGNARADANRGRQSFGGGGAGRQPAGRGGGGRRR